MGEDTSYLELIKQAQLGRVDSMSRLSEEAKGKICIYIYRVTFDYHLAQDLSQDTVLEMIKSLKRLKIESANSFRSWLYRTALGKIQHHFRHQSNKKIEQKITADRAELLNLVPQDCRSGLNTLLQKELSQVILKAMGQTKAVYRNILTLRCFDEMSYADIAMIMGVSKMQAMLLFFRAKQSLKKQLARNGFKKEHLLPAIGLFGAITASSTKSASAAVTVSAASAKVSVTTAVIGTATSTAGIATVTAVIIMVSATIGTVKVFKSDIKTYPNNTSLSNIVKTKAFELPSFLSGAYDPDGDNWKLVDPLKKGLSVITVSENHYFSFNHEPSHASVVLPKGHWLELGFSGEIVDGPWVDICFSSKSIGQPPLVFITDGAGQEVQITSTPVYQDIGNGRRLTGFDISGLSLSFKPRALRFVGVDNEGQWGGTELAGIWARVSQ